MNAGVRITVVRRLWHEDLIAESCDHVWPPCGKFEEGQAFVSEGAEMPEGFCTWAWCDIQKYVMTLARGGNFRGVEPGQYVTCCTDGFRPVLFRLERLPRPQPP